LENQKRKILLIEDNLGDIRIISDIIKLSGQNRFELYNSVKLSSGLEKLRSLNIDIVLLNLELPDSKGLDTLKTLRNTFPEIPVIVCTNDLAAELEMKVIENGAQDYLVKGHFDDNLLIRSIIYAIERKKEEKKLKETTRLHDTIFNTTNTLIVYLDAGFNVIKVNKAFQIANGREIPFYIGKNYFDFVPPDGVKDKFEKVVATGEPCSYFSRPFYNPLFPERGINYWDWHLTPLKDERNKVYALILTITDVTEHVVWEKQMQEEKDKAKKYFDIAGVILLVLDTDGNIVLINNRGCKILEFPEEEIIGKNWFDNFIPQSLNETLKEEFDKFISGNHEYLAKFENSVITKNGLTRVIEWENIILTNSAGKIIGTLSSGVDVTEKKLMEAEIKASKDRMNAIVESAMDAIISIDNNHQVILFNKAAEMMFGLNSVDIIGKDISMLLPQKYHDAHNTHIRKFGEANETIRRMGHMNPVEGVRANGEVFNTEATISSVEVHGQKVYTAILREVKKENKL